MRVCLCVCLPVRPSGKTYYVRVELKSVEHRQKHQQQLFTAAAINRCY